MASDVASDAAVMRILSTPPRVAGELDVTFANDALTTLESLFARHGDAYRVHSPALKRDMYVMSHPDDVKQVLVANNANYVKGIGIERVRILLGDGIMTSEGAVWRSQRRMVQPAFHRTVLENLHVVFELINTRLRDRWLAAADAARSVNVTQDLSEITLDAVLRALFGERYEEVASGARGPFAILTDNTERNLSFAYAFRSLARLIQAEIAWRRRENYAGTDFLSLLIGARERVTGAPMDDRHLVDETLTLIVAGHETTASTLNWLWYLLSQHVEADRLLVPAADAGVDPGSTAYDERYGAAVIEETLRLYPPGWLLTRRALRDDTSRNYRLPAGADVLISPYLIHRHPAFWDSPDRFEPARFMKGEPEAVRHAYFPFGAGPRACIGEQFARMEMRAHLRILAAEVRLELDPAQIVEIEPHVNLRTKDPLSMRPYRRAAA